MRRQNPSDAAIHAQIGLLERVLSGHRGVLRMAIGPCSELAGYGEFSRRFGIAKFEVVGDGVSPANAGKQGFVHIKAQWFFVRLPGSKFDGTSVCHNFVDHESRMLRVKWCLGTERRNEDSSAVCLDAGNVIPQDSGITA